MVERLRVKVTAGAIDQSVDSDRSAPKRNSVCRSLRATPKNGSTAVEVARLPGKRSEAAPVATEPDAQRGARGHEIVREVVEVAARCFAARLQPGHENRSARAVEHARERQAERRAARVAHRLIGEIEREALNVGTQLGARVQIALPLAERPQGVAESRAAQLQVLELAKHVQLVTAGTEGEPRRKVELILIQCMCTGVMA